MAGEFERIAGRARETIEAPDSQIVISAVNVWEAAIKRRLGKLDAPSDLLAQLERAGVDLLPITARHADRVGTLPMHHRDPFDRLLIAQASVDGLTLVTGDSEIARYEIQTLW
jgi:PIN domain nuclease of toxin-antitoxin system